MRGSALFGPVAYIAPGHANNAMMPQPSIHHGIYPNETPRYGKPYRGVRSQPPKPTVALDPAYGAGQPTPGS